MAKPTSRKLKPEIRAIVEWAEPYGWTLDDTPDGNDHWVLRHTTGEVRRLPATPSDRRGILNTKAEIRRISNIPPDSGPAARYRHESRRHRHQRFDIDAAAREARERAEARAEAEARQQAAEAKADSRRRQLEADRAAVLEQLKAVDPRRSPVLARQLAAKVTAIERRLQAM